MTRASFAFAAACFLCAAGAHAESSDEARAERLFIEGRTAIQKGDYPTGCAKFVQSLDAARRPNVLFNLALCEEHESRFASAYRHWDEGQIALDSKDTRVSVAKEKMAALEGRLARLVIRLAPETPKGARVAIDGNDTDAKALATFLRLDPGTHTVTLIAPGRRDRTTSVTLRAGAQQELVLSPGAPMTDASSKGALSNPEPSSSTTKRTFGFVALGVGVLGAGTAALTGAMIVGQDPTIRRECPGGRCSPQGAETADSSRTLIAVNYVGFGVAAVGAGVGAFLLVTSRSSKDGSATALTAAPLSGGASISMARSF